MSRDRGLSLQRALAKYLSAWWPSAESTPNGRAGSDVLGTPGIVWENKTARAFRPAEWVRQAKGHGRAGVMPVVVYWPDRVGEGTTDAAMAILPLPKLVELLVGAGYAGGREEL
jgi:hypothetical protein